MADTAGYSAISDLRPLREFVAARALALGLAAPRADLLMLAVNELATNTLQHTTGGGTVRVWADASGLWCDVVDQGAPRAFGRAMPPAEAIGGRGLAIVERICDDVSVFTAAEGTVVRMRLDL
ncbi:ATP-binding protein [Dactylosporangium sucinum]|uniref:Histidine kinase/HSP90-like ATPase domain-containing protein n=1 Tax=Dactylosporangium sucinum TaxID=1424081 RepID=A0A917U2S3_9ACTN|nr:ATP-binding protein [Dactylosporangium sucinum]GGM54147.1 hypothetical protein GCM10007977_064680 [Dactylosporangium sucinum]